jgi:hypothetical protein
MAMKDINIHYDRRNNSSGKLYGYGLYVYLDSMREGDFNVMPYHFEQTDPFEDCDLLPNEAQGGFNEVHPFMFWFPHNFYIRAL